MSWISDDWITRDLFVGVFAHPSNQSDEMDSIIEERAVFILQRLFGHELFNLFLDAGYTDDDTSIYYKLREGEIVTREVGSVFNYAGLEDMLKYFVLSEIQRTPWVNANSGTALLEDHNSSSRVNLLTQKIISNESYNKGVVEYLKAYSYLIEKYESFPAWKFSRLRIKDIVR